MEGHRKRYRTNSPIAVCNSYGSLLNLCLSSAGHGSEYCSHAACGVTFFIDEISGFIRQVQHGNSTFLGYAGNISFQHSLSSFSNCVFVVAQDDTLTPFAEDKKQRITLVREWHNVLCLLRNNGIPSESGYDPSLLNSQYDICRMRGCKLACIIYTSKILEAQDRLQGDRREAAHGCTPTLIIKIKSFHGFHKKGNNLLEEDEIPVEEIVPFLKRVLRNLN